MIRSCFVGSFLAVGTLRPGSRSSPCPPPPPLFFDVCFWLCVCVFAASGRWCCLFVMFCCVVVVAKFEARGAI